MGPATCPKRFPQLEDKSVDHPRRDRRDNCAPEPFVFRNSASLVLRRGIPGSSPWVVQRSSIWPEAAILVLFWYTLTGDTMRQNPYLIRVHILIFETKWSMI